MRILVLNFHRHRRMISGIKFFSLVAAILLVFGFVANTYASSQDYVSVMAEESGKKVIVIDAGHGGEDSGAIGVNGSLEKNLNMDIALEIGKCLSDEGYAVVYTRTEDKLLYSESENIRGLRKISDLKNRCKFAAEYPEAIFLSIHMNSYGDSRYSGLQVYYSERNEASKILASSIQASVKSDLQPQNRRVIKPGKDMYVLENLENTAVLVECGFLTNVAECNKLSEKEYQKQLSSAIVCGIIEYEEKISK